MSFWHEKTLEQMTKAEWESLCDGCGRCCLHKLRDEESGALDFTNVACRLLDPQTAQCRNYQARRKFVPDCVQLTPAKLRQIDWLPPSCAYRLLAEGKDLPPWHPLRSGTTESVITAGASVAGRCIDERDAGPLEHHIVEWPGKRPRKARAP
ncbi:YcgN family cysteine cluster protein [Acidocella sp.]|uniref:YcgN family cysteine cluster protein n=1 Tax=Acidocella sp. TaxID=50710 RepID=UPI00262A6BEC|nr:YcgN family cysteine cluster protein [Acidocella sp.]